MAIRKIVVFHNMAGVGSAWCFNEGIVSVLREMGYDVVDARKPFRRNVPMWVLKKADLVILSAPEWFTHRIRQRYGSRWARLRTPKVAWYAESSYRDDRTFPFAEMRHLADLHYFPAIQDAEEFHGSWLPFGVDTSIYKPKAVPVVHEAAFIGSIYPKRAEYLKSVNFPLEMMKPVSSPDTRHSYELLADAYCSTKILVNLPAYSRLLVARVTEALACGTFVLTPRLDHPSALRNMDVYEDRKHLVYYNQDRPDELAGLVRYYLAHPEERAAIAKAGHDEVHARHTLRQRLEKIIADAEALPAPPPPRRWWHALTGAGRKT